MIGKWIKESREAKGLSQNELAELMNTTRQCISHYENGRRPNPSLEVLKEFSRVLDFMVLIEKGEVIKMKRETGIQRTIEDLRSRLEEHFRYTNELTFGEFISQTVSLIEKEFDCSPTYRAFLPNTLIEISDPLTTDWTEIFTQTHWGRVEFEIEVEDGIFAQGISFEIDEPEKFIELIKECLPHLIHDWDEFRDDFFWCDVIDETVAIYTEEINDLIIRKIDVDR